MLAREIKGDEERSGRICLCGPGSCRPGTGDHTAASACSAEAQTRGFLALQEN